MNICELLINEFVRTQLFMVLLSKSLCLVNIMMSKSLKFEVKFSKLGNSKLFKIQSLQMLSIDWLINYRDNFKYSTNYSYLWPY